MIRAWQAPFGTINMDELDRRIMRLLRPNARRSYASIARATGVSRPVCVRSRACPIRSGRCCAATPCPTGCNCASSVFRSAWLE